MILDGGVGAPQKVLEAYIGEAVWGRHIYVSGEWRAERK